MEPFVAIVELAPLMLLAGPPIELPKRSENIFLGAFLVVLWYFNLVCY